MNANITKIETTQTLETMGETTEEQAAEWCEYLETKLAEQYPDAEISVELNNRQSSTTLYVECDLDEEGVPTNFNAKAEVNEFMNYLWDAWC